MAFISTTNNEEMEVYLTEYGRQQMLDQGFEPSFFSIGDNDGNYLGNFSIATHVPDLTGDHDDNVFSMSENIKLKVKIIR